MYSVIPVVVGLLKQGVFQQHECSGNSRAAGRVLNGIGREVCNKTCSCTQQRGYHGWAVCKAVVDGIQGLEIDGHVALANLSCCGYVQQVVFFCVHTTYSCTALACKGGCKGLWRGKHAGKVVEDDAEVGAALCIEHDGFRVQGSWHCAASKLEGQCSCFISMEVAFCEALEIPA